MQNILVSEIFNSIQGEGFWTGKRASFLRLQGCNMNCEWCDTRYSIKRNVGTWMSFKEIKKEIKDNFLVITGGEPLLQKKELFDFIKYIKKEKEIYVQIETNGTINFKNDDIDWITVSPKPPNYRIRPTEYNELKYVIDDEITLKDIKDRGNCILILQPENNKKKFIEKAIRFQKKIDGLLRLQTHKVVGLK